MSPSEPTYQFDDKVTEDNWVDEIFPIVSLETVLLELIDAPTQFCHVTSEEERLVLKRGYGSNACLIQRCHSGEKIERMKGRGTKKIEKI